MGTQMKEKGFSFDCHQNVMINENQNIPTVVYKNKSKKLIGYEALELTSEIDKINKNFKLDIGKYDSSKNVDYRYHKTADGEYASSIKLFEIFMDKILDEVDKSLSMMGLLRPNSLMVAEPLALLNTEEGPIEDKAWLSLYRANIKKYFSAKGFINIQFLPEPFAAFQYYKYIKKFPPLFEKKKYYVFVIDFGGGTFDTCVIETTIEGEINKNEKNARPIGASSIPKGGTNLDKLILDDLILKNNKSNSAELKRAIRYCRDVLKERKKIEDGDVGHQCFYKNYLHALDTIESGKKVLTNRIRDWSLDSDDNETINFSLPDDFFSPNSTLKNYRLSTFQYRDIFCNFYENELKKGISRTLDNSEQYLSKNIDYILLSGGSCQISWLKELITRDFQRVLNQSEFIKLNNYKEVVSGGLAIESARRFYTPNGDFADTTYNTINLILNPNDRGYEIPTYKCETLITDENTKEGVLIPSATFMRNIFDKKISWKFRLKSEPKHTLAHYFLRNTLDIFKESEIDGDNKYADNLLNINSGYTVPSSFISNSSRQC